MTTPLANLDGRRCTSHGERRVSGVVVNRRIGNVLRSGLFQCGNGRGIALLHRDLQRGPPERVDMLGIRPARDELRHQIDPPKQRSEGERRFAGIVGLIDRAVRLDQTLGQSRIAFEENAH